MKTNPLFLLLGVAVALMSCAPRVVVDQARQVDFSRYRTYAWMEPSVKAGQNPLYYNELATRQVEQTIDESLASRGLKRTNVRPDLLVGYHFFVEEKTRTVANPAGPVGLYGPFWGWGRWGWRGWGPAWWGWPVWGPMYTQEKYEAGTVVVDFVDARTKQLIWRGSVENAIGDPSRIGQHLNRQVARIIERFPQVGGTT